MQNREFDKSIGIFSLPPNNGVLDWLRAQKRLSPLATPGYLASLIVNETCPCLNHEQVQASRELVQEALIFGFPFISEDQLVKFPGLFVADQEILSQGFLTENQLANKLAIAESGVKERARKLLGAQYSRLCPHVIVVNGRRSVLAVFPPQTAEAISKMPSCKTPETDPVPIDLTDEKLWEERLRQKLGFPETLEWAEVETERYASLKEQFWDIVAQGKIAERRLKSQSTDEDVQEYRDFRSALQIIIRANRGLIISRMKAEMPNYISVYFEELLNYGRFGVWKAARAYDPRRGNRFSTIAVKSIHFAFIEFLREYSWFTNSRKVEMPLYLGE